MENLLLRYLRQKTGISPDQTASAIKIDRSEYVAMEAGELLISRPYSQRLGRILDFDPDVLYSSSLQLEMIRTAGEVNQKQSFTIKVLTALVRQLRPGKHIPAKNAAK